MQNIIKGFSRLDKEEKIDRITSMFTADAAKSTALLNSYIHHDAAVQKVHDGFAENTLLSPR